MGLELTVNTDFSGSDNVFVACWGPRSYSRRILPNVHARRTLYQRDRVAVDFPFAFRRGWSVHSYYCSLSERLMFDRQLPRPPTCSVVWPSFHYHCFDCHSASSYDRMRRVQYLGATFGFSDYTRPFGWCDRVGRFSFPLQRGID